MPDKDTATLHAAIAALETQRATLGDAVLEMALVPLRARLAALQQPSPLQHRQVAVLFADVVGSTAMAQALEAEDTLALLSDALRRMAEIVEAHQGRVLRYTGDGVKAAFGMDQAREDDTERAVRAGLAMLAMAREQAEAAQRLHGVADFAVRVGVHTGDVALGAGVEADNTAMGAAVNIAARMEQSADPGSVRISHDAWSHVRGLFDVEAQPPLQVKGVEAPMKTFLVRAALDRSGASVERGLQGLRTPLVGRQAELQRLLDTVALAQRTWRLQALTLLGDAGLGKSRLLRELTAAVATLQPEPPIQPTQPDQRPQPGLRLLAVRAQPDGLLRPWGLLRSLLAVQFGVADTDSAEAARAKVQDGLAPWFDERGERQAQLIGQLAGLDYGDSPHVRGLDPRSLRDQAFAALRAYLQALAARDGRPLLLLVEDLHWADDGSLDLLQHLLDHAADIPLALLMTARPTLLTRRPDWGPADSVLPLMQLDATHSDELAQALLQGLDTVPPALAALIVGQAEGNPYYMEELVRRLVDDGVITTGEPHWTLHMDRLQTVRLPGTLVGLLQARLDALPGRERQAARQASVVGHVFWDDALQALDERAPQALPALQRAAFVRAHAQSDFEGTPERQFDHHLLHQVTYDTLLKAERRLGHGVVARWLTARTQGRGPEFRAMTGEHAEKAGQAALALQCFEQAGLEAQKRYANSAAESYFRRALALLDPSEGERRFDLLQRLEGLADTVGDRAGQDLLHAEMAALLGRHPDDTRLAALLFGQALLADRRGDATASEPLARRAFEIAERCGAARWAALAQGQLAWLHMARHDYPGAEKHVAIGMPWARQMADETARAETEAKLLTLSGMVSLLTNRFEAAGAALTAVLARGAALGAPRLQLGALDNLGVVSNFMGRWTESVDWGARGLALARSVGSPLGIGLAQLRLGEAAHGLGDTDAAIEWHERNLAIFEHIGNRRMQAITRRFLAGLHLVRGEAAVALQRCAESLALFEDLKEPLETCDVVAISALCEIRLGRPEAALSAVNRALQALDDELAAYPAHETLDHRWACQQTLEALGDARAAPLLEQLHADVQARTAAITDEADRERLIQAKPTFRHIVAAQRRRIEPPALP